MHKEREYLESDIYSDSFNPKTTPSLQVNLRLGFIRKVFGIVSTQLLITTLFCLLSMSSKEFLNFQIKNIAIFFVCIIGIIIIPIIMICFESTLRKVPNNYVMLSLFTICESYIVGFICGVSNPRVVFMAASMTFMMVLALTMYAIQTKNDITLQGGAIFIFGCAFMMLSIFGLFTNNKFFHIILCVLGIILFGFYLVYDIQLIVGNKSYLIELDDYILASLMLYTDIISLFLYILELIKLAIQGE